jgi:hypothetical protein
MIMTEIKLDPASAYDLLERDTEDTARALKVLNEAIYGRDRRVDEWSADAQVLFEDLGKIRDAAVRLTRRLSEPDRLANG